MIQPPLFRDAEPFDPDGPGGAPATNTSYTQKKGVVADSHPRVVSNLIVDQTASNPAAIAAAGPDAITEVSGTLFTPNTATDAGLSAPFNSMFTFFGQFFDHGLDLVTKGGGFVFIPLKDDDPLVVAGPDRIPGTGDEVPPNQRFMIFTRATNQPGPDGILGDDPATAEDESADDVQEATNTTTPFVDQNQTYTSHPSHQVFLREYARPNATGPPVATGRLIDGFGGAIGTWAEVKAQALTMLGIQLTDLDIFGVPELVTDDYGRFIRGENGYPLMVMADGTAVEGNPAAPIMTAGARLTGHAFLDDIAHNAAPRSSTGAILAPDAGETVDSIFVPRPAGTYDDELLGRHYITGDGRGNENIALTAVHTIFHSEHNRLAGVIQSMILDPAVLTDAERAAWQADNSGSSPQGWNFGERLFQAAKFVTEMQYQHLVFEEFARKVQPNINPFIGDGINFVSDLNPAITAEFAHTVYRFGHSMLRDMVARTNPDGTEDDIPLLEAFLNPLEFNDNNSLSAAEAAGRIFQGGTRQVGNEIDEFITEVLRSNLLGLPLDLAAINLTRGRSEGIPGLNEARRTFFNVSSDSALRPYADWQEFRDAIKHPESLVNFIAAYGIHPTLDAVTTLADKRAAAEPLAADSGFLTAPAAETGVERIDYWVGGLAEKQNPFGGLLGSTFNWVFESQLEALQNADRFYYLERLDGLNLLSQLEANSFAELIMRNTAARGLPADVFSRPDLVLNLARIAGPDNTIVDDPTTLDINEATDPELAATLSRRSDGAFVYTGGAHVLWNGSAGADIVVSSEGDDTIQGLDGDDRLEGGTGNDQIIGGNGDDIITDTFGDDVLKGGPGNDAISGGPGPFDLLQGNEGNDFIVGGIDLSEVFGGPGDDIIYMGKGLSESIGGAGDDWMEGTESPASIAIGDDNNQFQNDPNGGHDILLAGPGDMDFDAEGGDDIMVGTVLPTHRFEGMLGFDWVTYRGETLAVDADMLITGAVAANAPLNELRDRFDLTEGLSGTNFNDLLRGDNRIAADLITDVLTGVENGHVLNAQGIARIAGLAGLLPAGATSWAEGNIILGGLGNDLIEGRGGNDRIDGDAWLNVQLRAVMNDGTIRLANSLHELKNDVFATPPRLSVNNISFVRSIVVPAVADRGTSDVAVFTGPQSEYTVTRVGDTVIVDHGAGVDGRDTLTNIELLRFADGTVPVPPIGTLTLSTTTPVENGTITATVTGLVGATNLAFAFQAETAAGFVQVATGNVFTPGDSVVGQRLRVVLTFQNAEGSQVITSSPTTPVAAVNDAPTGLPVIDDTTPAVGQTLTALTGAPLSPTPIADPDGLGPFSYQWLANNVAITGATAVTFVPTTTQQGQSLRVRVSWVDQQGFSESLTSAATSNVTGAGGGGGGAAGAVLSIATTADFGTKRTGTTTVKRVDVTNTGTANLTITAVVTSGAPFTVAIGTCGTAVAPGRRCRIDVTYQPTAPSLYSGTVTLTSNAVNSPTVMNVTGAGR